MKDKIEVGQILYRKIAERKVDGYRTEPYVVTKVGRTKFYCNDDNSEPINIDNLTYECRNYSQRNYKLYINEQDIIDEQINWDLSEDLSNKFRNWNRPKLTTDQLTRILTIINEP